jgi:hypothetical protein
MRPTYTQGLLQDYRQSHLHTPLLLLHSLAPVLAEIPIITERITFNPQLHEYPPFLARIAARRAIPWQTPLHLHVVGLIPSRTYPDVSALHADSK